MKNFLLGVMSTIIFGPIVKQVIIRMNEKLEEENARRRAEQQ